MRKIFGLLILFSLIGACANKGQDTSAAPAPATPTPTLVLPPGPTNLGPNVPVVQQFNFPTGAVVDLNISDVLTLEDYYGGALNLPAGPVTVKLNVDFKSIPGTGTYMGTIRIAYLEGANYHLGTFISGTQNADNVYNQIYPVNGQNYFKAFAQDVKGALILIVDSINQAGLASGKVYYRNFNIQPWQNPVQGNLLCWRLTAGPYDCRDFLVNNNVSMTSSIYPSRTDSLGSYYSVLGQFSNMNLNAAANM